MLIDHTYFANGPRHIQNATLGKVQNPAAQEAVAAIRYYIKLWQKPFLQSTLGEDIATKAMAYIEQMSVDAGEVNNNASPLGEIIDRLREPFANYVFFKILRENNTQATITGLVRLKCANDYVAPLRRQVSAWNDMVDMLTEFSLWTETSDCPIAGIETDNNLLTKINSLNL